MNRILTLLLFLGLSISCANVEHTHKTKSQQELLSDFIELRHGMFICFNIRTYGANSRDANYPLDVFNPTNLDCEQWAKAAVSANMKFGLLTTKHHGGFTLWDSKYNEYDVANTPYKKDIVRQYVDAFRKYDLKIGLYYSMWDSTNKIDRAMMSREKIDFIKQEITELLTNYGKVDYFVIDGWFWRMGHKEVPYIEIRELIRELQPECLVSDHTHLQAPYHVDIPYFEGPFGAFPNEDNTMASALGYCPVMGNGWFWRENVPHKFDHTAYHAVDLLTKCEARYCNFLLNCMPNPDGVLDDIYVDYLKQVGELWSPDTSRPKLPQQQTNIIYEAEVDGVTATSGDVYNLIAAQQMGTDYTEWVSDSNKTQSITLDLGKIYNNINTLNFVQAHRCKPMPEQSLTDGNITHCKLYGSCDDKEYTLLSEGRWSADAKMRSLTFDPTRLQYLRLDILEYHGSNARIIEMQVGNSTDVLNY